MSPIKKYAIEHNRTIQNASYDVKKAEAAKWKAIASMLPQVSGDVTYSNLCGYKRDLSGLMGGGRSSSTGISDTSNAGMAVDTASLQQASASSSEIKVPSTVSWGVSVTATISGVQIVGVRVAKIAQELSMMAVGKTDQVITSNIETSYVNILALQTTVQLLESNLENMDKMYNMTVNAVNAGVAEQNDADQIAIQVASMKSAVNTTKRTIEVLYNTIRTMMGIAADQEIVLTQKLEDVVNPGSILSLMGADLNLNNNYDYRIKSKSTELTKKQLNLSKAAFPSHAAFRNGSFFL